jgi:tetratricopeptide (TPR) repeat protein
LEDYEKALSYFDKVLEIDPTNAVVLNNKANILFKQEKYDEAVKYYDEALSQQPTFINATNNKALILDKQQKL